MRDMNTKGDRSIRSIPVPKSHRQHAAAREAYEEEEFAQREQPRRPRRRSFVISPLVWVGLGVVTLCAVIGLLLSTIFAGASVTVTPHTVAVTPPQSIMAQANAPAGQLSYQIITTSRTASTTLATSGTQHVSRAGTGVITIYNSYSPTEQPLIVNTRFAAPDGKIYRIHDSVTVPGYTKDSSGTIVPGSATVSVYADSPGDSYNRGATDFTIPGFKGDPRYTKFTAHTDSITGGFVGDEAATNPADLQKAEDLLKSSLDSALRTAASTQIPKEFLAIPGTLVVSFGNVTQTPVQNGKVTIAQSATASANILRANDLASAIAKVTVQGYAGEAVGFADPSQISIALASASTSVTGPLQLQLSGSPTLLWQFDPASLKAALVGKPKSDFEKIISGFAPAIECSKDTPCKASLRPFWSSTFPDTAGKINIVVGQ